MTHLVFSVPDPTAAATYDTATEGRFMTDVLVEWSYDSDSGDMLISKIGDTAALFDDPVVLASRAGGFGTDVPIALEEFFTTQIAAYALVAIPVSDMGGDFTYWWWQVNADGTDTLTSVSDVTPYDAYAPDGNREVTPRTFADVDAGRELALVPDGTQLAVIDPTSRDTAASIWPALLVGDVSTPAVQPDPPDPFDQTLTITGHHHTGSGDDEVTFCYWLDAGGDTLGNWDGVTVSWETSGYGGTVPVVYLGTSGVTPNLVEIDSGGTEISVADQGSTVVNEINSAYYVHPFTGGAARPGQLIMYYDPVAYPDVGDDFFHKMVATATITETITPEAATRYKQGQYTYLNAALNDTSTYDEGHLPCTDAPDADYYNVAGGRWTLLMGQLQDGDNYGGDNQVTTAVYFEPLADITGSVGAPRRRFFS